MNTSVKKRKNKRHIKMKRIQTVLTMIIIMQILWISVLSYRILTMGNVKKNLIKVMSKQQIVRNIVAEEIQGDYEEKIQDSEFEEERVIVDKEVEKKLTGYKNVVLFGIDARGDSFDSATRSDTIMLISINNDTGAVRMVSLYRDTYLKIIGNDGSTYYSKANSAYNNGGAQSALSTLNTNLDLNLSDYVVVNFDGLSAIIDMIGGIDVTISDLERKRINKICSDMVEGTDVDYIPLEEAGEIHLTGLQATAFCRIRDAVFYDEAGNEYHYDFGRTARQRYVMKKIVSKAKASGISALMTLVKQIMDINTEDKTLIKTSLDYDEIMDLIPVLIDYNIEGSAGFPYTYSTPIIDGADLVVAKGLAYNVSELHKFLFDENNYQPSASVVEINNYIVNHTGVPETIIEE